MSPRTIVLLVITGACQRADDPSPAGLDGGEGDGGSEDAGASEPCEVDAGTWAIERPLEPFCCTSEICAFSITACNPETCRCERVPCEEEGAPCDAALLPGVSGEIVCAERPGGLFCTTLVRDGDYSDCPAGIATCPGSHAACLCGGECAVFADDCAGEADCLITEVVPWGLCVAGGHRSAPEGGHCDESEECAAGLQCVHLTDWSEFTCERLDCGLMEGAPGCDSDERCEPVDDHNQLGRCGRACSAFDEDGPCAPNETCEWRGLPALAQGVCRVASDVPLPARGQPCGGRCRQGSTCRYGVCVAACDPTATADDEGACAEGADCIFSAYEPPLGFCAERCDPWSAARQCAPRSYCPFEVNACGQAIGRCRPASSDLGHEGDECWPGCAQTLRCAFGACRRACKLDDPRGCYEPQRCIAVDEVDGADHGACLEPCVPGRSGCPLGQWCEPTELDRDSGEWRGVCR